MRRSLGSFLGVPTIAPFPFDSLPVASRLEVFAARRMRRGPHLDAVREAVRELCGTLPMAQLGPPRVARATAIAPTDAGVVLGPIGAEGLADAVLVAADLGLAAVLLAQSLKQRAPRVIAGRLSPELAGAFAAFVHAVARRVHDRPMRVIAAGAAAAIANDLARAHGALATAPVRVGLGAETFHAALVMGAADDGERRPPLTRAGLEAAGALPVRLPLVLGTCVAEREDLVALAEGDLFVLPDRPLEGDAVLGPVVLVPPRGERGLAAELVPGRLVLRPDEVIACPWEAPAPEDTAPTLDVLRPGPVRVRVELGAVELAARDWARLQGTELTRRLGTPATLRAAGVAIARGTLTREAGLAAIRIDAARASTSPSPTASTGADTWTASSTWTAR